MRHDPISETLLWRERLAVCMLVIAAGLVTSTIELRDTLLGRWPDITFDAGVIVLGIVLALASAMLAWWPMARAAARQVGSSAALRLTAALPLLAAVDADRGVPRSYVEAAVAGIGAALLIASGWKRRKRRFAAPTRTADDPIERPGDDALGRASLACALTGGLGAPRAATRIAVTGPWGSGKSTFLNFVAWYAKRRGFVVARFDAWHYRNRLEAWRGFVAAIDRAVDAELGPLRLRSWTRASASAAIRIATGTRSAGDWLAALNEARLNATLDATKAEVSAALKASLGPHRRLLVVIDDLDRADHDVLHELLLAVKEIVNVDPCLFICGYDADAVSRMLQRGGIAEPKSFLSKIFEQTIPLPEPAIRYRKRFVEGVLREHPVIRRPDFTAVTEWLATYTARDIKKLARHIASVHVLASRYEENELNWRFLYMLELLRLEFPQAAAAVAAHVEFARWLPTAGFRRSDDRLEDMHAGWKPLLSQLLPDDHDRMRFLTLADGVAATTPARSESVVRMHLELMSGAEPLTWREYRRALAIIDRKGTDERLRRALLDERVPIERRREFVLALARDQMLALEQESDADLQVDRERFLAHAVQSGKLLLRVARLAGLHAGVTPVLDGPSVKELIEAQLRYLDFDRPFYTEVRALQREIIDSLVERVDEAAEWLLEQTTQRHRPPLDGAGRAAEPIWRSAADRWRRVLAKQALQLFRDPGGLKPVWNSEKHWPTKRLLFEKNEVFHTDTTYAALEALAAEATEDGRIQENFLQAILMLLHFAKDPGLDRTLVREALSEDRYRETLWRAATQRRLHRRVMGSLLLEDRPAVVSILKRDDVLPVPTWVAEHEPDLLRPDAIERDDATEHRRSQTDEGDIQTQSDVRRDRTDAGDLMRMRPS